MDEKKKLDSKIADALAHISSLSEKELQEWRDSAAERMKKMREDEERKRNTPPDSKTGVCVHCGGLVKGEYAKEATADWRSIPIGPGSRNYYAWRFKGYHCTQCGLCYKFPPPDGIKKRSNRRKKQS